MGGPPGPGAPPGTNGHGLPHRFPYGARPPPQYGPPGTAPPYPGMPPTSHPSSNPASPTPNPGVSRIIEKTLFVSRYYYTFLCIRRTRAKMMKNKTKLNSLHIWYIQRL